MQVVKMIVFLENSSSKKSFQLLACPFILPTGTWNLTADHFESIGRAVAGLNLPTLCVQEGGYKTRTLGKQLLACPFILQ
jgi:hypothetical protein